MFFEKKKKNALPFSFRAAHTPAVRALCELIREKQNIFQSNSTLPLQTLRFLYRPPTSRSIPEGGGGWGVIKKVSPRRRRTRKENVQYSRPPEWIKWRESFETDDAKELETSSARKSQNVRPFRSARETENTRLNYAHDN